MKPIRWLTGIYLCQRLIATFPLLEEREKKRMRFDTLKSEVPIDIYYTQIDIIDTLFSIFDYSIAK